MRQTLDNGAVSRGGLLFAWDRSEQEHLVSEQLSGGWSPDGSTCGEHGSDAWQSIVSFMEKFSGII